MNDTYREEPVNLQEEQYNKESLEDGPLPPIIFEA
jgi:hypothetical protein